jgi:D-alanyl-D-alanine carboxypeptidase
VKDKKYKESYEFKLGEKGYSSDEIVMILDKYENDRIDFLLSVDYNEHILKFMDEKYYIHSKLNEYLEYKNNNKKSEYSDIVALVNVEMHIDWLDNMKDTDTSKNELMLVNRVYGLSEDFVPADLVDVPSEYAYSGKKLSQKVLDEVIKLIDSGKNNGYTFVISDGYRSYEEQKDIYDSYADFYGMSETDTFVARPGHSEYQTGMSFDLKPYNKVIDDVSSNEEYLWLRENAYKYGFIFRFEKEDKHLTGFSENSWRLRYVGKEAASVMRDEDICFEEYYAYYVGE